MKVNFLIQKFLLRLVGFLESISPQIIRFFISQALQVRVKKFPNEKATPNH
jgi:hypothetical protein